MSKIIEFWFDFSSPYAYFASETVERVGEETGRAIVWRPFLLGAVFGKTNMAPLADTPMRGDYARRDWARIARLLDVPFRLPEKHPYAAVAASRAFYWTEANLADKAPAFAHAVFRSHFAEGEDPADEAVIARIADGLGISSAKLLSGIQEPEINAMLRQRTDEAIARNIFGAPFFIVDGEPFWGWDRLPLMRQWIERGGW